MANEPSIRQLRTAFSIPNTVEIINEKRFVTRNDRVKQNDPNFNIDNTDLRDEPLNYRSSLNTPVYTNIEFLPGSYETNTKGVFKNFGSSVDGPEKLRYESVLLTVSQSTKIVQTEIQGRDGSVKEYIGKDDYSITVNGIITGKNGQRPIDEIIALKKMLDAPIAIEVASAYLQSLGIDYLVLKDWTLNENEGGYSYQQFSLSFISDIQQELQLTNL